LVAAIACASNAAAKPIGGKPRVIETIEKALSLFVSGPISAHAAAQRLGMHLMDDGMLDVTFTPRDRTFEHGSALREAGNNDLGLVILDVAPHVALKYSVLRDAFGPFKAARRQHPGDDAEFLAYPKVGAAQVPCSLVITFRTAVENLTGDELVDRISIGR
jgi:hypothetical protein